LRILGVEDPADVSGGRRHRTLFVLVLLAVVLAWFAYVLVAGATAG